MVKVIHKLKLKSSDGTEMNLNYYPKHNEWDFDIEGLNDDYAFVSLPYEEILRLKKFLEELA